MGVDRWIGVLAVVAGLAGAALAVAMWRRVRRSAARDRGHHPAASSAISLTIAESAEGPRWRAAVAAGWPPSTLDILTYRRHGSAEPWTSEPIVDPIALDARVPSLLDGVLPDADATYDVVIGWTSEGAAGPVTGSRVLTVPLQPAPTDDRSSASALAWAYPVIAAALVATAALAAVAASRSDASEEAAPTVPRPSSTVAAEDVPTTTEAAAPLSETTAAVPSTTEASTTTAAVTTTVATTATTTSATPSSAPTTAPVTVPTTAPPTTAPTSSAPTTAPPTTPSTTTDASTTVPGGPAVRLDGRVEDCRFGADCVIVGFRLDGFVGSGEYVCEFDDGSRFTFRYVGDGADDACARSGVSPSIVVEVDGLRSPVATRDAPDGA